MFKRIIAFVLVICLSLSIPTYAYMYYLDIEDNWAKSDIIYATNELGVFNGYTDGTFKPDNEISRSEFCTILARTCVKLGMVKESYTSDMDYADLTVEDWSYTYVITLYEYIDYFEADAFEEIFPGEKFQPLKPISREEVIQLVSKFCKYAIYDNDINFDDMTKNYKFYDEVKVLYNAGIIQGFPDNTLKTENLITRAESAAIIKRIYNYVKLGTLQKTHELQYMNIENSDINSFFDDEVTISSTVNDKKYIKAKNTLEYLEFGGYIFPDDARLYDSNPIETLNSLRTSGYDNLLGIDFYLLKYGQYGKEETLMYANELLSEVDKRNNLEDFEYEQIFSQIKGINTKELNFIIALLKWYSSTEDVNCKFNINVYLNSYYKTEKNKIVISEFLKDKINIEYDVDKIVELNFNDIIKEIAIDESILDENSNESSENIIATNDSQINDSQVIDNELSPFTKYTNSNYMYEVYNISDYDESTIKGNVVLLNTKYANKIDDKIIESNLMDGEIFYKYILNRAILMRFINQDERNFIDLINQYELLQSTQYYKDNSKDIDVEIQSILLDLKYKIKYNSIEAKE